MLDIPSNRAGWQAINRRATDFQRNTRIRNEQRAIDEHDDYVNRDTDLHADCDTDLPFSRTEARLEVQRWWWWQL